VRLAVLGVAVVPFAGAVSPLFCSGVSLAIVADDALGPGIGAERRVHAGTSATSARANQVRRSEGCFM
jgi:hypothetical protein